MIDYEKSAELNGMIEKDLRDRFKRFPQSNKIIVAVCDACGNEREAKFQSYHPLCITCSNKDKRNRRIRSNSMIQFCINNPKIMEMMRLNTISRFSDPLEIAKVSDKSKSVWLNTPEVYDDSIEKRKGGNDILNHHIIYDHTNPTKNIIKMTRSMHTKLHRLFQKHNIEIPHINVTELNKNIFRGRKFDGY